MLYVLSFLTLLILGLILSSACCSFLFRQVPADCLVQAQVTLQTWVQAQQHTWLLHKHLELSILMQFSNQSYRTCAVMPFGNHTGKSWVILKRLNIEKRHQKSWSLEAAGSREVLFLMHWLKKVTWNIVFLPVPFSPPPVILNFVKIFAP